MHRVSPRQKDFVVKIIIFILKYIRTSLIEMKHYIKTV